MRYCLFNVYESILEGWLRGRWVMYKRDEVVVWTRDELNAYYYSF